MIASAGKSAWPMALTRRRFSVTQSQKPRKTWHAQQKIIIADPLAGVLEKFTSHRPTAMPSPKVML